MNAQRPYKRLYALFALLAACSNTPSTTTPTDDATTSDVSRDATADSDASAAFSIPLTAPGRTPSLQFAADDGTIFDLQIDGAPALSHVIFSSAGMASTVDMNPYPTATAVNSAAPSSTTRS